MFITGEKGCKDIFTERKYQFVPLIRAENIMDPRRNWQKSELTEKKIKHKTIYSERSRVLIQCSFLCSQFQFERVCFLQICFHADLKSNLD